MRDKLIASFGIFGILMFIAIWVIGVLLSIGIPVGTAIVLYRLIIYHHL